MVIGTGFNIMGTAGDIGDYRRHGDIMGSAGGTLMGLQGTLWGHYDNYRRHGDIVGTLWGLQGTLWGVQGTL